MTRIAWDSDDDEDHDDHHNHDDDHDIDYYTEDDVIDAVGTSLFPQSEADDTPHFQEEEEVEEDAYHENGQLVLSDQQVLSQSPEEQPAPIHYHIYYEGQPPPDPSSLRSWLLGGSVGLVLLAHLLYRYGPSVPPPPPEGVSYQWSSWEDFNKDQMLLLSQVMGSWWHVVQYVAYWCLQGLHYDVQRIVSRDESDWQLQDSSCQWKSDIPQPLPVFGQSGAWQRLQQEVIEWQQSRPEPLVVYVTGSPGIGKRHLLDTVAQHYMDCSTVPDEAVLDLSVHNSPTKEAATEIQSLAREHVQHHPLASILLVNDAQVPNSLSEILPPLWQLLQDDKMAFSNCIVFVISTLGGRTIDKTLQYALAEEANDPWQVLPMLELESLLRLELAQAVELSQMDCLTILPLIPLGRSAMREWIQYLWNEETSISPSAMELLLDKGVEWQTWSHKTTHQELWTVAPHGRKVALELTSRLSHWLSESPCDVEDSNGVRQLDVSTTGTLQLQECSSADEKDHCQVVCQLSL